MQIEMNRISLLFQSCFQATMDSDGSSLKLKYQLIDVATCDARELFEQIY